MAAHIRVWLSHEAFQRLNAIAGRNGRAAAVEASLVLEAALLGVLDLDGPALTLVSIQRAAETKCRAERAR